MADINILTELPQMLEGPPAKLGVSSPPIEYTNLRSREPI